MCFNHQLFYKILNKSTPNPLFCNNFIFMYLPFILLDNSICFIRNFYIGIILAYLIHLYLFFFLTYITILIVISERKVYNLKKLNRNKHTFALNVPYVLSVKKRKTKVARKMRLDTRLPENSSNKKRAEGFNISRSLHCSTHTLN